MGNHKQAHYMMYRPNYFLTPAVVAYDDDIPYAGDRLYSIIYWLSEMHMGKCIASNATLAEFMGKSTTEDYVIRLLKKLEDKGYISRTYSDDGKQNRTEIIPNVVFRGGETTSTPRPNHTEGGGETILQISNSYKEKNISNISELPSNMGKTPLSRLKTFYSALYVDEFKVEPRVFLNGKDGGVLKSLLKDFSEVQVAALMIAHFNWYGPDGSQEWEHQKLVNAAFPITWITPNVNKYALLITSLHKTDFGEAKSVFQYDKKYLRGLSTDGVDKNRGLW